MKTKYGGQIQSENIGFLQMQKKSTSYAIVTHNQLTNTTHLWAYPYPKRSAQTRCQIMFHHRVLVYFVKCKLCTYFEKLPPDKTPWPRRRNNTSFWTVTLWPYARTYVSNYRWPLAARALAWVCTGCADDPETFERDETRVIPRQRLKFHLL